MSERRERQGGAPLGIVLGPSGADVAVYSAHASAAYLCLYDEAGEHETGRVRLTPGDGSVHRGAYGLRHDEGSRQRHSHSRRSAAAQERRQEPGLSPQDYLVPPVKERSPE